METEEVKILAKLPVVPPLDIGQVVEIKPQLLGIGPGGAVDAGEHRVLLVATPVCTGYRQELERIGVQLLRRLDMWTAAQVGEAALVVDRDRLTIWDGVKQLELELLAREHLPGLIARDLYPPELLAAGDDRLHTGADLLKIALDQLTRKFEIIVEPVLDRWTDRNLRIGEHLEHGLGHYMCHRVAYHGKLLVFLHRPFSS